MERGGVYITKKGQFYLIAAIILSTIIIGIAAVNNYAKKDTNIRIYDLKEELQIESAKVYDYGANSGFNEAQMYELLNDFTQDYIDSESRDKDLYFIFGNENNITVKGYQKSARIVSLDSSIITTAPGELIGSINPTGTEIILSIEDNAYNFKINKGENFYFVISQQDEGGDYIISG